MPEAARVDDPHECHLVDGNHPHRGGPVEGPASSTVNTGHRRQARAGDRCHCDGAPDFIVTGSASVYVDGKPAARKGDRTMHPPAGALTEGCASVHIGGPRVGGSVGAVGPGLQACALAASTRDGARSGQSYGNCGVESVRQLVNLRRREPLSERAMLDDVLAHREASESSDSTKHGGSTIEGNVRTLRRHGVAAREEHMTFAQIVQAVAEGRGVISSHFVSILWGPGKIGRHAILVTGATFDDEGRVQSIVVNDTGLGECGNQVDATTFERSLIPGNPVVVTDRPVW